MPHDDLEEPADRPRQDATGGGTTEAAPSAAGDAPRRGPRAFASLAVPEYRRFTYSFIFSSFALQAQILVRAWLAFELTNSPFALSTVLVTTGAVRLVISPIGGVFADRFDRKSQIIAGQAVSAVSALVIGLVVWAGAIELWHLLIGAAVHGAVFSFQGPARQAFVFNIVGREHVANAVTLNSGIQNAMRLVAPALAGVLIGVSGAEVVYFIIVGAFALSIVTLVLFVSRGNQPQDRNQDEPALRAFTEGVRYIWRHRSLFWLVITAFVGTGLGLAFRDMLPAFSKEALGLGPEGFGLLTSMIGLGALAGSLALAFYLSSHRGLGRLLLATGIAWGVGIILLSVSTNIGMAIGVLLLLGAFSATFNTYVNILIQTNVEDAFRGRVLSFYMITFTVHTFGALPIGAFAEKYGIRDAFLWTGLLLVGLMSLLAAKRSDIRRMP